MPAAQTSPTFWQRTRTNSKAGFDKIYGLVDKLGAPVNRLSNKLGSEAFWPTTLDKESDKAARILKSFCSKLDLSSKDHISRYPVWSARAHIHTCTHAHNASGRSPPKQLEFAIDHVPKTEDGFYAEETKQPEDGPKSKQKVLKKIPAEVRLLVPRF